jgi:hypothetical protein
MTTSKDAKATGLTAKVLRAADRPIGSGLLSDQYPHFVLIGDGIDAPFSPTAEMPALRFVREQRFGQQWTVYAEPFIGGGNLGFAFGGNWLWSGDSRFPADHPIRIHDQPHYSR